MSLPYSLNLNPLTQLVATPDGMVEQLPIGALRVPGLVGLRLVGSTNLSVTEVCYIVYGGIFCLLNGAPLVLTCLVFGAITICVSSYEDAVAVTNAANAIRDRLALAKADCVSNNVAGSAALAACIAAAEAAAKVSYERLNRQYGLKGKDIPFGPGSGVGKQ
jgi:hypothetical protein